MRARGLEYARALACRGPAFRAIRESASRLRADDNYVCPDDPVYPYPLASHRSYELQSYDNAFVTELDDGSTTVLNSSGFWPGTKGCHWRIPEDRTRTLTKAYHACVSHIDDELGRLFDAVKRQYVLGKHSDNSMVRSRIQIRRAPCMGKTHKLQYRHTRALFHKGSWCSWSYVSI